MGRRERGREREKERERARERERKIRGWLVLRAAQVGDGGEREAQMETLGVGTAGIFFGILLKRAVTRGTKLRDTQDRSFG